ncbi:diguanylate cyclase [Psychromonas sp. SP041]|uniref:diguanylate cyclase domain-containing protein n=1 Tax=Psychromonas sp. SP041 TaxID=1365007 RepID=UPI000406B802|nr:diguanylate cyclase [Psychromonas sp. SP041]
MLRAKRFYSVDFVFFIAIFALILSTFFLMSDDENQQQQRNVAERTVYNSFVSTLDRVKSNAILLFELQYTNESILSLLDDANKAKKSSESLQLIQQQLHDQLQSQFRVSSKYFPEQKIYLINGDLLLNNAQSAYSSKQASGAQEAQLTTGLGKVLKSQSPSFGLSLRNGRYLYRYFFPVFNASNEFIAVVEIAMPLANVQYALSNISNAKSQYLLAKRPLLASIYKNKFYQETEFSSSFFVNKNINLIEANLSDTDLRELKKNLSSIEESRLMQLKRFSINAQVEGQEGIAVFMPIHDVEGYNVGGVLTFIPAMKWYISSTEFNTITIMLILMLGLVLLYAISKSTAIYKMKLSYQQCLDVLPFPIFLKDSRDQYFGANRAFYSFLNISKKQLLERDQHNEYEPDELKTSISEINEAGGCIEIESDNLKKDDDSIYKISYYEVAQQGALKHGVVGYIEDVSNYKLLNDSLKSSLFDQTEFMDILPLGVRIFNLEGRTTYINKMYKSLNGFNVNDLLSADCEAIFNCLECHNNVCSLHKNRILKLNQRVETIKYNASGEALTYEVTYQPYYSIDKKVQGIIELICDITINKSLLDKNHTLMLTDELTGVSNYRGLISAGDNYFRLAQRAKKAYFSLYVNVVGMEKINETQGKKESEQLLIQFANILKNTFRETDIIARTGDDEFIVLMNDSEYEVIDNTKFIRLDANVKKFNSTMNKAYRLVIDTGIVEYNAGSHSSLSSLIKNAEQLVYEHRLKRSLN